MYTRCPECHSTHPLSAADLARAGGMVACGRCSKVFNALGQLFDEWPAPGEAPATTADVDSVAVTPPTLGNQSVPEPPAAQPKDPDTDDQAPAVEDTASGNKAAEASAGGKRPWIALSIILFLVLLVQLLWWQRERAASVPALQPLARVLGAEPRPATDNPTAAVSAEEAIRLVSRDMHPHPSVPGALVLSALLMNQADSPQPYPVVAVTLTDAADRILGYRRFEPADYLGEAPTGDATLQPDVYLPILLEFADPGDQAVGFRLEFH